MGNHFYIPHVDCVRLNHLVVVTSCTLFPFCRPHSSKVERNWTILIRTVTVYTQNLHLQRCVCVCLRFYFGGPILLCCRRTAALSASGLGKKKKVEQHNSFDGGVRAAELPAERTETYASVPLTAQISVRDRLRLTRANTHTVTGESGANVHKRTERQKLTRRYRCGYQKNT